ncbi:MAG: hypothetical protein H7Y42_07930 [Chitinophagaceae bacterium]|nr:hypothetical protein [Chitinophagaceae bacterium]
MKTLYLAVLIIFISSFSNSQAQLPTRSIQVMGGYSGHGSGDLKGIVFGADFLKYKTNRFFLDYNLRGTINYGEETIIVNNTITGTTTDASIRFTTAGVQLGLNAGYSLVRSKRHEFAVLLGGFGRFQSASNGSDGYSLYGPQATGQPTILVGYDNRTPQNTIAAGAVLQLNYNYTINNKCYIGISPGFQTDTNGDAVTTVALVVGRRL